MIILFSLRRVRKNNEISTFVCIFILFYFYIHPIIMDKIQLLEQTHLHENPEGTNISKLCTLVVLISSALLLFLVITLNVVFDMSLFVLGINFIYELQNAMPSNFAQTISNLISYLCKTITMGILIVISYILINRKLMLLVYLCFYFMANYIYHILN